MNILFVLYHDFTCNSASHVRCLAEELGKRGHECCVAVPDNNASKAGLGPTTFTSLNFGDFEATGSIFSNGRGPDILHAWTPRELVRVFCEKVRRKYQCRLFVHLEDNELHLLSCFLHRPEAELLSLDLEQLDALVPQTLSHPRRAKEFLNAADGITIIIDQLAEMTPPGVPTLELWPSADERIFHAQPRDIYKRRRLGVPENCCLLVYTGNVHPANAHEVRSLYLAVAVLNREGFPTTLIRTGRDFSDFLGLGQEWGRQHVIDLGFVPLSELGSILCLADVLVQPGRPDAFNDYRFPSKLPEFLSVGRPVVLPNTNIAKHMTHGKHAYLLSDPSAVSMASAIREIMSDSHLYAALSSGSIQFFRERLSWLSSALKLEEFYSAHSAGCPKESAMSA